jgi:hypothetical protein
MNAELKVSVDAGSATRTSISCVWPGVGLSPTASPKAAAAIGVRSLNIVTSLTIVSIVLCVAREHSVSRRKLQGAWPKVPKAQ